MHTSYSLDHIQPFPFSDFEIATVEVEIYHCGQTNLNNCALCGVTGLLRRHCWISLFKMHLRSVVCLIFMLSCGRVYCQEEAAIVADPGADNAEIAEATTIPPPPVVDTETPSVVETGEPAADPTTPPVTDETPLVPAEETTVSTGPPSVAPDEQSTSAPGVDAADTAAPVATGDTASSIATDAPLVIDTSPAPADNAGAEGILPAPMGPNGEVLVAGDITESPVTAEPVIVVTASNATETNTTEPETGAVVGAGIGGGVAGSGPDTSFPAGAGNALGTGQESGAGVVSTESSNSTSPQPVVVPPIPPVATITEQRPPVLDGETTTTTTKHTTTAKKVAPVESVEGGGWWKKGSLLAAGIILLIGIVLGYIYACCCIKSPAAAERRRSIHRGNIEDGGPDTGPIVRPIESLTKSNKYVDEMINNANYHHQETRRERDVFLGAKKGADLSTPNNSFTSPEDVTAVENQNSKFAKTPVKPSGTPIPIGTPINSPAPTSAPAAPHFKYGPPRGPDKSFVHAVPTSWDRRLDAPPSTAPLTSRDVINASRVNNAVVTVAAAGATPVRNGEGERPLLRGATLPAGGTASPSRNPTYRTTLLFTPVHNQDPDVELPPGEVLPYKRYVESIKGRNSDFAQYSPEYNREMAELERRNAESQL